MSENAIRLTRSGVGFAVRLTPRGGRDAIDGWGSDAGGRRYLKARVRAAPTEGAANAALIALLARSLHVAKSDIRIARGASARVKLIEVDGDGPALMARLAQWNEA